MEAAGTVKQGERKIEDLIDEYDSAVHMGLDYEPNYETEALLTLILRDVLEDRWGEMGEPERRRVETEERREELMKAWRRRRMRAVPDEGGEA